MLLNACLTVTAHQANSHKDQGWEQFTDAVITAISKHNYGVVFLLWGAYAQKKAAAVDKVQYITEFYSFAFFFFFFFFLCVCVCMYVCMYVCMCNHEQYNVEYGLSKTL